MCHHTTPFFMGEIFQLSAISTFRHVNFYEIFGLTQKRPAKRWEFWRVNRGVRRRRCTSVQQSEQHAKKMKFSQMEESEAFYLKQLVAMV